MCDVLVFNLHFRIIYFTYVVLYCVSVSCLWTLNEKRFRFVPLSISIKYLSLGLGSYLENVDFIFKESNFRLWVRWGHGTRWSFFIIMSLWQDIWNEWGQQQKESVGYIVSLELVLRWWIFTHRGLRFPISNLGQVIAIQFHLVAISTCVIGKRARAFVATKRPHWDSYKVKS